LLKDRERFFDAAEQNQEEREAFLEERRREGFEDLEAAFLGAPANDF
jgi:hypothetical protein